MKALVVDDSKTMRMIVKSVLKQAGFEIVEAKNGIEALEKIKEHKYFDLATVDWNMPEMNGLDLVKELRTNTELDNMRIMMATSEAEESRVATVMEAGANDYIMKPFQKETLADKIKQMGLVA